MTALSWQDVEIKGTEKNHTAIEFLIYSTGGGRWEEKKDDLEKYH
jgi:hypothetical protein